MPIQKWPICPISALREKFNPRNIIHMPAVKFSARLDLEQIFLFLHRHYIISIQKWPICPISVLRIWNLLDQLGIHGLGEFGGEAIIGLAAVFRLPQLAV